MPPSLEYNGRKRAERRGGRVGGGPERTSKRERELSREKENVIRPRKTREGRDETPKPSGKIVKVCDVPLLRTRESSVSL